MLTREQFQQIELEGHLAEILADSCHVLQARYFWNKNHDESKRMDISEHWNRAAHARQLLAKLALREPIDADDIGLVQHLLVAVREENDRGDGDLVE
ncbi:MAG: hypothetical protein NTW96_25945 [Planctomycetia bacterium]|nr:hypothetical protein [Planctomycetia bacterium]